MKLLAVSVGLAWAVTLLAGCMDTTPSDTYEPRVHEYFFKVSESPDATFDVYEKNDGSYQKIVATAFMDIDQDVPLLPNPTISVMEGDTVIIHLENTNPLPHTIHLHGWTGAWEQDGVDYMTQFPTMPGENITYVFEDLEAGTYFYHCHVDSPHHQDLGMYGAFIVKERKPKWKVDDARDFLVMLDEMDNCHVHGNSDPLTGQEQSGNVQDSFQCYYRYFLDNLARNGYVGAVGGTTNGTLDPVVGDAYCDSLATALASAPKGYRDNVLLAAGCGSQHAHGTPPPQQAPREWWFETHPVYAPLYNTYILNGYAFPDTPVYVVEEGELARFRLINAGNEVHSMHWHGHKVLVTHKDLYPLPEPYYVDTLALAPGERYEVILDADNPGIWMFHDHVGLQTQNDDQHPGGIMTCIAYAGWRGLTADDFQRGLDCNLKAVEILEASGHTHAGHGGAAHGTKAEPSPTPSQASRVPAPPVSPAPPPAASRPSASGPLQA
jgi:FtsP/CotA-like multicopper oxidase with cupredoxin domain